VTELCDADMDEEWAWRDFVWRGGFIIIMGVLVPSELSSSSVMFKPFDLLVPGLVGAEAVTSERVAACCALFRVAAPREGSKEAEPCSCSTNSSHFTDRLEFGRSARSARFKQSFVRCCKLTQRLWKCSKSPSVGLMLCALC
jgi:hypothetical protein